MVEVAIASVDVYIILIKRNKWHCGLNIWILLLSQVKTMLYLRLSEHSKHAAHTGLWDLMWGLDIYPKYKATWPSVGGLYALYHICSHIRAQNVRNKLIFSHNSHLEILSSPAYTPSAVGPGWCDFISLESSCLCCCSHAMVEHIPRAILYFIHKALQPWYRAYYMLATDIWILFLSG